MLLISEPLCLLLNQYFDDLLVLGVILVVEVQVIKPLVEAVYLFGHFILPEVPLVAVVGVQLTMSLLDGGRTLWRIVVLHKGVQPPLGQGIDLLDDH